MNKLILVEMIENKIYLIRGKSVMFDKDLATIYGVKTRDLNKAVTRNIERFPGDFMFQLTKQEYENLMFQFGTSSWGGTRKLPRVFTEHGVAMLSSVLRSKKAIQINIAIMRVFVKLKEMIANHKNLANKLKELEKQVGRNKVNIQTVFQAIHQLMKPVDKPSKKIGFLSDRE